MNSAMLELEQRDIELQLQEIQLKRQLNKIERDRIMGNEGGIALDDEPAGVVADVSMSVTPELYLHYNKSARDRVMRIADVCPDGSIMIYAQMDSMRFTNQYSMKSLSWIRANLPKWSKQQKEIKGFYKMLAEKYSSRFAEVCDNTMQRLCYLVDSGKADVWFEKYEDLKNIGQSTLEI